MQGRVIRPKRGSMENVAPSCAAARRFSPFLCSGETFSPISRRRYERRGEDGRKRQQHAGLLPSFLSGQSKPLSPADATGCHGCIRSRSRRRPALAPTFLKAQTPLPHCRRRCSRACSGPTSTSICPTTLEQSEYQHANFDASGSIDIYAYFHVCIPGLSSYWRWT
jgi:hypothetical protein